MTREQRINLWLTGILDDPENKCEYRLTPKARILLIAEALNLAYLHDATACIPWELMPSMLGTPGRSYQSLADVKRVYDEHMATAGNLAIEVIRHGRCICAITFNDMAKHERMKCPRSITKSEY